MRLVLALAVLFVAAPAFGQGRTTFATERHDFARIDEGPVATTTFAFTNTGDRPVRLVEVRPSCGCTTPEYPTGAIAPGATAEIVVAYASEGRPGPFEKHVTVVTDGGETTTLTIVGDVIPGFTRGGAAQGSMVFERDVFIVDAEAGEAVQQAFRFQNQGEAPVRITSVRTSAGDAVQVVFPDRPVFARDVAGILVTVENPAAIARADGSFDIAITMETTDTVQPVKSLRLRGVAQAGG
ncbi:MAG TPA: DUF1573 domain-containing protein [Rubricoccaceae bacterium]|jgi:hypothetical protein